MLKKLIGNLFKKQEPLPAPPTPSSSLSPRDRFIAEIRAVIAQDPTIVSHTLVDEPFALDLLRAGSTQTQRMFLDNLFAETREMVREDRAARIAIHLKQAEEFETFEQARAHLLPVIRGATFGLFSPKDLPESSKTSAGGLEEASESFSIRRPYLPFLDILAVIDSEATMSYVSGGRCAGWKVTSEQVFASAMEGIPLFGDPAIELVDEKNGPLFSVRTGDTYETSRLLVPDFLSSFEGAVSGRPIAILPERSTLLIGGDEQPGMVERLLAIAAKEFAASRRCISPALYTIDEEGEVIPYPAQGPHSEAVRLGHGTLARYEYGEQKRILDESSSDKDGPFIATYKLMQGDGEVRSHAVWTRGVATWLPETDAVALYLLDRKDEKNSKLEMVPFAALRDRLTPVPNLHPPRYATGEFPTEAEIARMR